MRFHNLAVMSLAGVVLHLAGCSSREQEGAVALSDVVHSAAGVQWSMPAEWTDHGERPMRVASYIIPASEGDPESGECAVFFFGSGQGGDVDLNIQRWISQFEGSPNAIRSTRSVHSLTVTMVQIRGNYLAPSGPM
ncbi:MAG: hypothetical protein WD295_03025, partial [Bacteroidota bacterium]